MGSIMDQERPWERETSPTAETMRERIKDAYRRSGGRLEPVMDQIIIELERIEASLVPPPPAQTQPVEAQGAVGEAGEMPGSNGGFTMAAFKATDVPVGTKLYAAPQPAVAMGEVERLRAAIREFNCPRPCNNRPNDFTAGQCLDAGECGCMALAALHGSEKGE